MKLTHKILSLGFVLAMLALASCEEQKITFEGTDYVRFTDSTEVYKESIGQPIEVQVHVVGKPLNQAVTVNYTVSGNAREGRDYVIEGTKGVVTIPAGKYFGTIVVRLINNANNILGSQDLVFELSGVSSGSEMLLGQAGGKLGKTFRLTIQDDCLFSGFYTGRFGTENSVPNIEISSLDCKTYKVANWNIGLLVLFNFNAREVPINFEDNGDNTLKVPIQVVDELPSPYDTLSGNGLWNPQTKAITLNLKIKLPISDTKDSVYTVPFVYTPRQ